MHFAVITLKLLTFQILSYELLLTLSVGCLLTRNYSENLELIFDDGTHVVCVCVSLSLFRFVMLLNLLFAVPFRNG